MRAILITLLLLIPGLSMAQSHDQRPPYDPANPDHQAACIAWVDNLYLRCLDVMCGSDMEDLALRVGHCIRMRPRLDACCAGFPIDDRECPRPPLPGDV